MTALVLTFGIAMLCGVLTSALASRSPLSTSTVFLVVGLVAGPLVLDAISVEAHSVEQAAEIALFAILFTDGQHAPVRALRCAWGPPTRALLVAMPLTMAAITVLGHVVAGLDWGQAAVLGAVLAPTDPVFASALVGREDVPRRVRMMLNVESGLNDGLALPAVLVLAGTVGADPDGWTTEPEALLLELAGGVLLGVLLPLAVAAVLRIPGVGAVPELQPLGPLSLAILLFGVCAMTGANPFLAAFVAGSMVATLAPPASESFRRTGELVSEMTKGAALLAFATLVDADALTTVGAAGWLLAVAAIVLARPIPVLACLLGTSWTYRERWSAAWFGPKGFASVAYALIVASSGMTGAEQVFALTTVTVLVSVVAHSSTDVLVAEWLSGAEPQPRPRAPDHPADG